MKNTTLVILFSIISSLSYAGGTGGGGVMSKIGNPVTIGKGTGIIRKEYLKVVGKYQNELILEYGQANQKDDLFTEEYRLRPEEIKVEATLKAIQESALSKDWVEINDGNLD